MDVGARLQHARESRGLTIEALSRSTRVQPRILSAIEQNDAASMPPRPYGRGFVRVYAAEVGLDPDETVRSFFSQFARDEPATGPAPLRSVAPERAHPWGWAVAAVLGYAAVGAIVVFAGRWAMQSHGGEAGAVGTVGAVVPAAVSVQAEPAPPPPARPSGVVIELEAQRPAWITAIVDGRRTVYRTIEPGERVTLNGTREVTIRTGDAGAVRWQVNGQPAVPMGAPGEVRTVRITPGT